MPVDILVGLQWGDEGKGKIVDVLAPKYDVVARFQGGPNAGHTLEFEGTKHVLHQIPSGIFHEHITNIIGNGVVLDPIVFRTEVEKLTARGIDATRNLFISKKAQLILPSHKSLDRISEEALGTSKIGSTQKGIGPAYQDKIGRSGLRVGDILLPDFQERYNLTVEKHQKIASFYQKGLEIEELEQQFFSAVEFLRTFTLVDSEYMINQALKEGKKILAEGAQGSLLDIDFGTYPYVTSSNTLVAGACTGLGIAPRHIGEVYGIFKAYCTRVGSGPFPTELHDEVGEKIRQAGREFGSTTGRPRRCGWIDLPTLKYAIMLNGVTQLNMMKADVLDDFEEISICTHYKLADGTITDQIPHDLEKAELTPVYITMKGWGEELRNYESYNSLPKAVLEYVAYLEEQLEVSVNIISVGPDRISTLVK
ncbi:adenylosuccinate synthase [Rufibacter glacialis]|uniref:Adenylosuccinate synthetase n=1 Tax=Rufibacter glacialis TaxID=1259555 RepID=A0A5M8QLR4_9BACT|nr:adenylosuccinate synthase [Rufibacter glacialis]KAA6435904.1 adenylosuccinate synthase [Rufibacter glacialis]GGK67515.1 adenylosuccinate synthetase [Rufibacter glacialis]